LSFVLTSRDHKPQRVAAVLVCAAAALVIFVMGRSPVSGTATIGQAKSALNPEGTPAPIGSEPAPRPPAGASPDAQPKDPTVTGRDHARGLVVPANEAQTVGGSSEPSSAPAVRGHDQRPSEQSTPANPERNAPNLSAPKPPASPADPAQKSRTEPKAPVKRNPAPTPPGGKGGEFDFGI
jgi:hypothetical protein